MKWNSKVLMASVCNWERNVHEQVEDIVCNAWQNIKGKHTIFPESLLHQTMGGCWWRSMPSHHIAPINELEYIVNHYQSVTGVTGSQKMNNPLWTQIAKITNHGVGSRPHFRWLRLLYRLSESYINKQFPTKIIWIMTRFLVSESSWHSHRTLISRQL